MPYVDPRYDYYLSLETEPRKVFRRLGSATERWDDGRWLKVSGNSLGSFIYTGDLSYAPLTLEEAHAYLNPAVTSS